MDKPQEPVRETVGRYGPPLWNYKGKLSPWQEASQAYEKDRADWAEARIAALESALREAVALCGTCDGKGGWGFEDEGLPFQPCPKCAPVRAVISAPAETNCEQSGDKNG